MSDNINVKSIFLSKTFWITGVFPVLAAVSDALANGLNWRQALIAGFGALAIVLRSVTKTPVK